LNINAQTTTTHRMKVASSGVTLR